MTEKICLKWNNFQSNVTSAFRQLRTITHYQDVTLVSDDNKNVSAHRIILSAGSDFFNEILSQNNHSHPLLCLDGINSSDLKNVLDYIYNGELQIYPENLDRFLQIAQKLKLKGLLSSDEKDEDIDIPTEYETEQYQDQVTDSRVSRVINKTDTSKKKIITMNADEFQSVEDLDLQIQQQILRTEDGYKCLVCNKVLKTEFNLKEHIETHMKGLSFDCKFCGKKTKSRSSLRMHETYRCKYSK